MAANTFQRPELKVLPRAISHALNSAPSPPARGATPGAAPIDRAGAIFEASNGVKLIEGGYRHPDSRLVDDAAWFHAQDEARAAAFDMSFEAQRRNAFIPNSAMPADDTGMFDRWWELPDHEDAADWLLRGYLEACSLSQLFGAPGAGKTFLALDWAACIAAGSPWLGRSVKQGPVLYIAAEGRRGLNRRLKAWCTANGVARRDLKIAIARHGIRLINDVSVAEVCAEIAEFARQVAPPRLVVIDTLARNFGSGDENSTADMTRVVAACDEIRERTGAAVLLVHHTGHGDQTRARGSIAMNAAVDHEYCLSADTSDRTRIFLTNTKQKDEDQLPALALRLTPVDLGYCDDEGKPVTSCVLRETDGPHARPGATPGHGKRQLSAVEVYFKVREEHEAQLERGGLDPRTARVSVDDWAAAMRAAGIPRQRVSELRGGVSRRLLVENGYVTAVGGAP